MKIISFFLLLFFIVGCTSKEQVIAQKSIQTKVVNSDLKKAYFAAGCFWCVEEVFESVKGVHEVYSGYSGGQELNPTYSQVSAGRTGHAESVEVLYDPKVVSYQTLVNVFFASHDPTTLNQQGPDKGKQYRSVIFYTTPSEKQIATNTINELLKAKTFNTITTEVLPFKSFWIAEDYHQDYIEHHPTNPYVQGVSIPRFEKFKAKMPEVLKNP